MYFCFSCSMLASPPKLNKVSSIFFYLMNPVHFSGCSNMNRNTNRTNLIQGSLFISLQRDEILLHGAVLKLIPHPRKFTHAS